MKYDWITSFEIGVGVDHVHRMFQSKLIGYEPLKCRNRKSKRAVN